MNRPKQLLPRLRELCDSPTLLHDMGNVLSAYRVGTWFTFTTLSLGGLLGLMVYLAAAGGDSTLSMVSSQLGLGQYLACVLLLGLGVIFTVLVPIRVSGIFEGPRWGRYFDQLVLTGIAPARYFAGKILSANMFFLLIVVASLPFAVFCLSLGGARIGYVFWGMVSLWLYVNLLAVCVLAMATFSHDVAAVASAVVLFGAVYGIGLAPLPLVATACVPSSFLMNPFYDALVTQLGAPPWELNTITLDLGPLTLRIGGFAYFLLWSLGVGTIALGVALMGPIHCLMGENSTFGEVVMKGDSRRSSLFRRRYSLRRRSEMSFFYENRTPWLTRWEAPLRYGGLIALMAALCAFSFGILHYQSTGLDEDEFAAASAAILGGCLLIAAWLFSHDRSTLWRPLQAGSQKLTVSFCDTTSFVVTLIMLFSATMVLPLFRDVIQGNAWLAKYGSGGGMLGQPRLYALAPFVILLGVQHYALIRILCCRYWTRGTPAAIASAYMVLLWIVPFAGIQMMESLPRMNLTLAAVLGYLSPVSYLAYVFRETHMVSRNLYETYHPVMSLLFHGPLTALLVYEAYRKYWQIKRYQEGTCDDAP